MPESSLYEQLDTLSQWGNIKKEIPDSVAQNLNQRNELRPYQIEAFARFFHCYKNDFPGKAYPLHFLFNMATGSGKLLIYQLFIEPKGRHLKEHDRWEETFLKEITAEFGGKPLTFGDKKYRLIGVPFYNNEDENQFRAGLESVLN